jgi:ATP-binding cassette subfamily B (MDR/TAP) protein 1
MIIASSSLGMISPTIPILIKAAAAAQQILKLLVQAAKSDQKDSQSLKMKPDHIQGHIKIENVSFWYPERPTVTVLNSVTFDIAPRKVTAVVGHSGSGKSTLVGMLQKWYDPSIGSIIVDGTNIRDLDLKWWRGQVGLVQQVHALIFKEVTELTNAGTNDFQ